MPKSQLDWVICGALVLAVLAIYAPMGHFAFVTYDDPAYVTENAHVRAGLTLDSIRWALTAVVTANWLPVTMLSHLAACEFFGLQSGLHHRLNEVIHALAAVLLFVTLRRATRAPWPSAFVALIFAIHPLHVESVAWISERKDVLSAFFWFLAIYAYVLYAERPSPRRYLLLIVFFCLGLMSKPMLVTFPFTLLLARCLASSPVPAAECPMGEDAPLRDLAGHPPLSPISFRIRQARSRIYLSARASRNALVSYIGYIGQTFWPSGLAVSIPTPMRSRRGR